MPRGERPNVLYACALLVGALGCAGGKDLGLLRQELTRVQQENDVLTRRVAELEAREAVHKKEAEAPVVTAAPEEKPLKVVKLEPQAAGTTQTTSPGTPLPTNEPDDDAPRPMLKLGPSGSVETTLPDDDAPGTKKHPKKSKTPVLDPQAAVDYDAAFALIKQKKTKQALDAFAGFIVRYPDHPYAANALFWRGECYFSLGEFAAAVGQYEGMLIRFPAATKAPDALLKLGLAHKKLGSAQKARASFDRLRKEWPASEAAKKIPPEDAA